MRKIVVGMFMTLDGVVEGPGPSDDFALAGWTMPYWDDAIGQAIGESAAHSDALLLGRVTYQGFAEAFAGSDGPDGAMMNDAHKYVVSNTLKSADWQNSTLLEGDVIEAVTALKAQPGGNINISGSITLVHALMQHGLIDEYQLIVYPVILGQGRRLFVDGLQTKLKLVDSKQLDSGVVLLTYRPE